MLEVGKFNLLTVCRMSEFGCYLDDGRDHSRRVLLPNNSIPPGGLAPGDRLEVFLYLDSEDRLIATTRRPAAQVGELALLRVKEQTKIGAFLDWGLEKDLFVPFREQPERQEPRAHGKINARRDQDHHQQGQAERAPARQRDRNNIPPQKRVYGFKKIHDRLSGGLQHFHFPFPFSCKKFVIPCAIVYNKKQHL